MNFSMNVGFKGQYQIRKIGTDGKVNFDSGLQDNLITDLGLEYIGVLSGSGNLGSFTNYLAVGSSNTPPSNADTILGNFIGSTQRISHRRKNTVNYVEDEECLYKSLTNIYEFNNLSNVTLTELGLIKDVTKKETITRALIKDSLGNPTTITVLKGEVLIVSYTLTLKIPVTTVTKQISVTDGTQERFKVNCTMKNSNINLVRDWDGLGIRHLRLFSNASLRDYTQDIASRGSAENHGIYERTEGHIREPYVAGSHKSSSRVIVKADTSRALSELHGLHFTTGVLTDYQCILELEDGSPIPFTKDQSLEIGYTVSWGRA